MGAASRRRIQAGGPTSTHRSSLSLAGLDTLRQMKGESQAWRCGWCIEVTPLQLEHAVNRSQGGGDTWDNTWMCCPDCHRLKDRPFEAGRLLTIPLGNGLIDLLWVVGPNKYNYEIVRRKVVGRAPTPEERVILEALV